MGESYVKAGVEDVVFAFMRFQSGLTAHMHLSWLDPHKERRFTVVGSKRMATFDDMELERKLTVYDKGFDEDYSSYGEYIARSGDVFSPADARTRSRCGSSAGTSSTACGTAAEPRSGAESALRVVRVLERLQRSLAESSHVAGAELGPRSARRASCSARAWSCPTTWRSAATWSCTPARGSARARGSRTAA